MVVIAVTMIAIILIAAAVLVYAAFPNRGVQPSRGRIFVRAIALVVRGSERLAHFLAVVIVRVRDKVEQQRSRPLV